MFLAPFSTYCICAEQCVLLQTAKIGRKPILSPKLTFNNQNRITQNNFTIQDLPTSYKGRTFFKASFIMTHDVYNYFCLAIEGKPQLGPAFSKMEFITKFLWGNGLQFQGEFWKPVTVKIENLFGEKSAEYRTNFIILFRIFLGDFWDQFSSIFICSSTNSYDVSPTKMSLEDKQKTIREEGGTLNVPFCYGPSLLDHKKDQWRIGQTYRITPCIPQTRVLSGYFYDEEPIVDPKVKGTRYIVKAPKIKVFISAGYDNRVIKNLALLLHLLQITFKISAEDIKNVVISHDDYLVDIWNEPNYNFRVLFLNPLDHGEVSVTKDVRFYCN